MREKRMREEMELRKGNVIRKVQRREERERQGMKKEEVRAVNLFFNSSLLVFF